MNLIDILIDQAEIDGIAPNQSTRTRSNTVDSD